MSNDTLEFTNPSYNMDQRQINRTPEHNEDDSTAGWCWLQVIGPGEAGIILKNDNTFGLVPIGTRDRN